MANIPNTLTGPRVINGVLKWIEGDTFVLNWKIDLFINSESIPYSYEEGDQLIFSFYANKSDRLVYSFIFSEISEDNTVTLRFTKDISKLFKAGLYTYSIKYMKIDEEHPKDDSNIITIGSKFKVEVEKCH